MARDVAAQTPRGPTDAIRRHISATLGRPVPNMLILVVPDGVAKVTVLLSPGPASKHSDAVTAVVHNNVAAFLSPYAVENLAIDKMIWRAADGHVIKRRSGPY